MEFRSKFLIFVFLLISACGGNGWDNGSGKIFEGLLTQGETVDHAKIFFKHAQDEPIEEVKICALGRCSTTDGQGNFGFSAPDNFLGGAVLFTVDGHGILAETTITIPEAGSNVFIHLQSSEKTEVHLHHLLVDGVAVESSIDTGEQLHE